VWPINSGWGTSETGGSQGSTVSEAIAVSQLGAVVMAANTNIPPVEYRRSDKHCISGSPFSLVKLLHQPVHTVHEGVLTMVAVVHPDRAT